MLAFALCWTAALIQGPEQAAAPIPPAVALEREVRRWALDPSEAETELRAAQASPDWRRRHAALVALSRSRPAALTEVELGWVLECLADEQPNVRAAALEVSARGRLELPATALGLVKDELPEVRLALARALEWATGATRDQLLLQLAADADPLVAWEAACVSICAPGEGDSAQAAWHLLDRDLDRFLHGVDAVERAGRPRSIELAREYVQAQWGAARWLLLEATLVPLGAARADALVPSWLLPVGAESSRARREAGVRLLEAAESLSLPATRELLERAVELARAGESDPDSAWDAQRCLEAVHAASSVASAGDWPSLLAASGLETSGGLAWGEDFALEFWSGFSGERLRFDATALRGWLGGDIPPAVRLALAECLGSSWQRSGDLGAGELLAIAAEAAEDEVRRVALLGLVGGSPRDLAASPELDRAALAAWSRAPLSERLEDLRQFDREQALSAGWQRELARLWSSGEGRVVSTLELLATSIGDLDVPALFASWLDEQLAELEAGEVPAEETTRGAWRESETRARWLLEGWTRATEHRDVRAASALLTRVDPLGKELSKLLVSSLARTREGAGALVALFAEGTLTRRSRIEVALLVQELDRDDALELFLKSYSTCDEELRLRILARLGQLAGTPALSFLADVALGADSSASERVMALDALAATPVCDASRIQLVRVLRDVGDLDLERSAIRALGVHGDESIVRLLYGQLATHPRSEYLRDELLPAIAQVELRTEGELSPRTEDLWCATPAARAAAELSARFRGERLPSSAFVYSEVIAIAEALAARGQLEQALAPGWEGWDARLLLRLASVAANGGRGAGPRGLVRELNHAALVGLLGEAPAADQAGLVLRARARLLELALVAGDWRDVEGWSAEILAGWRSRRTSKGALLAVFGSTERAARRSPEDWLRATNAQARARLALAAGDLDRARRAAAEAAQSAARSERASRQQAALESDLRAAER